MNEFLTFFTPNNVAPTYPQFHQEKRYGQYYTNTAGEKYLITFGGNTTGDCQWIKLC